MAETISAKEARTNFAAALGKAIHGQEPVQITKNGKLVAALVSIEYLRQLEELAFKQALSDTIQQYGPMLERLAK